MSPFFESLCSQFFTFISQLAPRLGSDALGQRQIQKIKWLNTFVSNCLGSTLVYAFPQLLDKPRFPMKLRGGLGQSRPKPWTRFREVPHTGSSLQSSGSTQGSIIKVTLLKVEVPPGSVPHQGSAVGCSGSARFHIKVPLFRFRKAPHKGSMHCYKFRFHQVPHKEKFHG